MLNMQRLRTSLVFVFALIKLSVSVDSVRSFGRDAVLGQLYDARTDTFLNESIAKEGFPDDVHTLMSGGGVSASSRDSVPRFPGESSLFNYKELERIEILADYIEPKGASEFFKEGQLNPEASIIIERRETWIYYEPLNFGFTKFQPFVNVEPLKTNSKATHVVVGISWGWDFLILLEDVSGNQIEQDYAYGLVRKSNEINARDANVNVKIFTDIPPPSISGYPKTAGELREKYPEIFQYIVDYNDKKGTKKSYKMIDIDSLRRYFNATGITEPEFQDRVYFRDQFNFFPMRIFEKISKLENEMLKVRNRLNSVPSFEETVLAKFDNEFRGKWEAIVRNFKLKLMEYINLIRAKEEIPTELIQTLNQHAEMISNFERKSNIQEYDTKFLLLHRLSSIGITYQLGEFENEEILKKTTALIVPAQQFAAGKDRSKYFDAEFYLSDNISDSKVVIDCDFPNQFCGEELEPKIVLIENGKVTSVIEY